MNHALKLFPTVSILLAVLSICAVAQSPGATPTPEDPLRIPTEEVHLTISARGPYEGITPKLRPEDLTIYEDGVSQTITSLRSMPAHVLILLDTGAALTFAKNHDVTTAIAQVALKNLPDGSFVSIAQYSDGAATIVPWTAERNQAMIGLSRLIKTGRRSLLRTGLDHSVKSFVSRPIENRHLILITDGLDGPGAISSESPEFSQLGRANVVVHILSYSTIEKDGAERAGKTVRLNTRPSKPRVSKEILDEMVLGLPAVVKERLKMMNEARQIIIVDLDAERRKMLRTRREEWEEGEERLRRLADETGGDFLAPSDVREFLVGAAEIARSIGSHYDVTYMPARTISESGPSLPRAISVVGRSESLKLRTRKTLTVQK
jgi:hypothetical protein